MRMVISIKVTGEVIIPVRGSYEEFENLPEEKQSDILDNVRTQIENSLPPGLELEDWEWWKNLED